jgi:hypothetical protein
LDMFTMFSFDKNIKPLLSFETLWFNYYY